MFQYATDVSKWEEWQKDYKYGLILIIPPQNILDMIEPLRKKYDPTGHKSCITHISVSDPINFAMSMENDIEVADIIADIEPFLIKFQRPQASRKHPGIAYPIFPREPIENLKNKLHQAAIFKNQVYVRRNIPPHLTLAEFITIEESIEICNRIQETSPSGEFLCDRLELVIPDENFVFRRIKSYHFNKR